jgi:hypothetical protein
VGLDLGLGRDFEERPLPRAGFGMLRGKTNMPLRLRAKGAKRYTWAEYLSEQGPIPTEDPIREVWRQMGMTQEQQDKNRKAWAAAVAKTALMAGTGGRITEDVQPPMR